MEYKLKDKFHETLEKLGKGEDLLNCPENLEAIKEFEKRMQQLSLEADRKQAESKKDESWYVPKTPAYNMLIK